LSLRRIDGVIHGKIELPWRGGHRDDAGNMESGYEEICRGSGF
jgi:hypothetical protein